jgi:gliding motility-associated-like protein
MQYIRQKCLFLLFFLPAFTAYTQHCSGSLGDPIVDITFGNGTGFGQPLPEGTTSELTYVAGSCPNDGFYSIVNSTGGCFGGTWNTVSDHTGGGNGYFMLINASYEPSDFYTQTIGSLCGGTTYEFAAWLTNMCNYQPSILPNITMTIEKTDGTILASYNTGDVPVLVPAVWQQYGFVFTIPQDISTVVLRMRNNADGGMGNDVGMDDITFRPAGPAITASITGITGDTVRVCERQQTGYHFESVVESCYASTAFRWQISTDTGRTWSNIPGATSGDYNSPPGMPGIYLYRLVAAPADNIDNNFCRVASAPIMIQVLSVPHPNLGPDTFFCTRDTLLLYPGNFDTYNWQDGSSGHTLVVKKPGQYSVNVSNSCGNGVSSIYVSERSCDLRFPSAFTPNNDGVNDIFTALHAYNITAYHLTVYNRWGQLVFATADINKGWDGNAGGHPAPMGLFVWSCEYRKTGNNEPVIIRGIVNLIR